ILVRQFLTVLKNKDKESLKTLVLGPNKKDLNESPLFSTIALVHKLVREVLDCHCYFNQHDRTGNKNSSASSKLASFLSKDLAAIHVDEARHFFSNFAPKIFFIYAIKNAMPAVNRVLADSNKKLIKAIERV